MTLPCVRCQSVSMGCDNSALGARTQQLIRPASARSAHSATPSTASARPSTASAVVAHRSDFRISGHRSSSQRSNQSSLSMLSERASNDRRRDTANGEAADLMGLLTGCAQPHAVGHRDVGLTGCGVCRMQDRGGGGPKVSFSPRGTLRADDAMRSVYGRDSTFVTNSQRKL